MKAVVYTLTCPITNEIRYVGITTTSLDIRLSQHMNCPSKGNKNWIDSLKDKNLRVVIETIEQVSGEMEELLLIERYWINQFIVWGFKLNNHLVYLNPTKHINSDSKILTLRVEPELKNKLIELAKKDNRSLSNFIAIELEKITNKNNL